MNPKGQWTPRKISAALLIVFVEGLFIGMLIGGAIARAA